MIELIREHIANEIRHRDIAGVRVVLEARIGQHRVKARRVVGPAGPGDGISGDRVTVGVVELQAVGCSRHAEQQVVSGEPNHLTDRNLPAPRATQEACRLRRV